MRTGRLGNSCASATVASTAVHKPMYIARMSKASVTYKT
jgi:hypothetical protein